ncbi:MAG: methylated-DNA--[protein]-cysteine S-methyltransferase [Methylovulum sp.]|nr:methylated-DNA--[protein]-cysteine S-methyltransferase [Methylovulum sp.]
MPFIIHWIDRCTAAETVVTVDTPAGKLILSVRQEVICNIDWVQDNSPPNPPDEYHWPELSQYWLNPDIPVTINLLRQGSAYRQQVWAALAQIPIGETLTYSALAKNIGSAARAVGNACRDNPYPLFIPCHRVVAASGMGGYCGQTDGPFMTIKHKLLAFEAAFKK